MMMIEAASPSVLSGRALRRVARFCATLDAPAPPATMLTGDDLRFFLGAYLGALVFFLAWLV